MKYLTPLTEMFGFENEDDSNAKDNETHSELETISDHITLAKNIPDDCLHDQLGAVMTILDKFLKYNNYALVPDNIDEYYKKNKIYSNKINKFVYVTEDEGIATQVSAATLYPDLYKNIKESTTLSLWEIKNTNIKFAYYDVTDSTVSASDVYISGSAIIPIHYKKLIRLPIDLINGNITKTVEILHDDNIDIQPFLDAQKIGLIE